MVLEVQPTIVERGASCSRGVLDHAGHALDCVKAEFVIPPPEDPVLSGLVNQLRFLRGQVFAILDAGKARLKVYQGEVKKIGEQLANGTERYDDLPGAMFPFKFLGPTQDVDRIRQKILDERAKLLEEKRRIEERFWSDTNELKNKAAEVFAEYVRVAAQVEALTCHVVPVPALTDVFAFMEAPEPEEVLVLHPPDTPTEHLPLLERLP